MIEKMANRQLFFIVFIMRTTVVIATLPVLTSAEAGQDAWIAAIVTMFGTLFLVLVIGGLSIRFPELTIIEISERLLGKYFGAVVSIIILWSFLHIASIEARVYAEMIVSGFLTETPLICLAAGVVLVAAFAAYHGIETIGRSADLIFPMFIFVLLLSMASMLTEAEFQRIQPVLPEGLGPVLEASITPIGFGSQLLVLGMLIPNLTYPQKGVITALWGVIGASVVLIFVAALTVTILGPEEGERAIFPFFLSIRAIEVSEFLERMEILVLFAWGLGLFIALSIFIYSGARGVAKLFKLNDYKFLLLVMGIIWIGLTIHNFGQDVFDARSYFQPGVKGPYTFFLIFFPYIVLWISYFIRKALGKE